jgi:hypothetical protein
MAARYPWFESPPESKQWHLPVKYPDTFNVDIGSPAAYEEPIDFFIGQNLRQGVFPLWNPFLACGTVIQESFSTRALFPLQLLQDISPWQFRDLFLLIRIFLAALGVFLFIKLLGLSFYSALCGGLMYGLSGSMTVFLTSTQMSNIGMVLPYALAGVELLNRKQDILSLFFCILGISLLVLGGQPEVSFYGLVFICAYYIFRVLTNTDKQIFKRILVFSLAIVLALVVSSPFFVPFLMNISQYYTLHPPGGTQGIENPTPIVNFTAILFPELLRYRTMLSAFTVNAGWDCLGGYTGLTGLFLILAALGKKWQGSKEFLFFLFFGLFILLKNMGMPVFNWIGWLPVFNQIWTPRWTGPVWSLSLVLAAVFGLEAVLAQNNEPQPAGKSSRNRLIFVGLLASLCIINFKNQLKHIDAPFKNISEISDKLILFSMRQAVAESVLLTIVLFVVIYYAFKIKAKDKNGFIFLISGIIIIEMSFHVTLGYDELGRLVKLFYHLIAALFLLWYASSRKDKNNIPLCLFVSLFSLGMFFTGALGVKCMPEKRHVFSGLPDTLNKDKISRMVGIRGILFPNSAAVYGIQDIKGIVSLSIRRFQLFQDYCLLMKPQSKYAGLWFTGIMEEGQLPQDIADNLQKRRIFYSLAGVGNYLSPNYEEIDDTQLIQDGPVKNYRNLAVFPRAFIVYKWIKSNSPENSLSWMLKNQAELTFEAVIEGERVPNVPLNAADDPYVAAKIKSYGLHAVIIETQTDKPGLLILTDTYHPDWRASLDGKNCEVFPADLCFRGVWVPEGKHEVKFIYFPKAFYICVNISLAALLIFFILCIKKYARWIRK